MTRVSCVYVLKQDAFYLILQHIKDGHYTMIAYSVHFREVAEIEEPRDRIEFMGLLNLYGGINTG